MHMKKLHIQFFKRFTNLTIQAIPQTTRLIVLTGPNGSGKSSLFDAFKLWHLFHGGHHIAWDDVYHRKSGATITNQSQVVSIDFYEELPAEEDKRKKAIYVRSAYRNDPDFTTQQLQRMGSVFEGRKISRLIDNDSVVSENYQRLVSATVEGLYSGIHDTKTVPELRETFIGQVRQSMSNVFDDLLLTGPGDPLTNGAFYFEKGTSRNFHYKNLSGGEKAAFDLILDIIIKRTEYNDTVYAIDEPEAHMHTRLQARLLGELLALIPVNSQLWIATHSIGMMRKAKELKQANPESVAFLDFGNVDLDSTITIEPMDVDRPFWVRNLGIALDDLASLVAPSRIVLCEGEISVQASSARSEFDARCYRIIFMKEFPETDFISAGNSSDVESDRLQLARSLQRLFSTMSVIKVVDRDDKSEQEIADLSHQGITVLSRRHLESYLLDDEVLAKLCISSGKGQLVSRALAVKQQAISESVNRGNAPDDVKSAAGQIYNELRSLLSLSACGNNTEAFLRDTMAPLITLDTQTYAELKHDIFGL